MSEARTTLDGTRLQAGIQRRRLFRRGEPMTTMLRGTVVKVYPADDADAQDRSVPAQTLCDVLLARGGILRAPVAQHGSSVANVSRWCPTPARTNMITGEKLVLTNDGLQNPPSRLDDLDGEQVLVAFIEGEIDRPVIMASLEHPRGVRQVRGRTAMPGTAARTATDVRQHGEVGERFVAHQGTTARIDHGGSIRADLRRAGVGNDDRTYDAPDEPAGNVDVALRAGSSLLVRNEAGEPIFVLTVDAAGSCTLDIGRTAGERMVLGDRFQTLFDNHRHTSWYGMTGPVAPDGRIATAQAGGAATRVLSERARLPAGEE